MLGALNLLDTFASREVALRVPWLLTGVCTLLLFGIAGPRLTSAKFAAARAAALN